MYHHYVDLYTSEDTARPESTGDNSLQTTLEAPTIRVASASAVSTDPHSATDANPAKIPAENVTIYLPETVARARKESRKKMHLHLPPAAEEMFDDAARAIENNVFVAILMRSDGAGGSRKVTLIPRSKRTYGKTCFRSPEAFRALVNKAYELRMKPEGGGSERLTKIVVDNVNGQDIEITAENVFDVLRTTESQNVICYFVEKKRNIGIQL